MLDAVNTTAKIMLNLYSFAHMCHLSLNYIHDSVQSGLLHSEHTVIKTRIEIHSWLKMIIYIHIYIYIYIY